MKPWPGFLLGILAALEILVLAAGCGSAEEERPSVNSIQLADDLEKAGFFRYAKPEEVNAIKKEIQNSGFLFPESVGRFHPADAETLAECGVLEFIGRLGPFLNAQGVRIPFREKKGMKRKMRDPDTGAVLEVEPVRWVVDDTIPDDPTISYLRPVREICDESGYAVTVGEFTSEIWNDEMTDAQCWEAAMCNTFLLINRLLKDAGSQERIYGLYGGNDGGAVFLTRGQFDLIREAPGVEQAAKPWVPYEVGEK
jgi:hypothetical protein